MKLNVLFKQTPYLTKQNLSLALKKEGESLNYWIKKLLLTKELLSLKNGFYVSSYYLDLISQNPGDRERYIEYLANTLRIPSYVSLEYVLANAGMLPEAQFAVTSVTVKSSRIYQTEIGTFAYRNVKERLFSNFDFKEYKGKKIAIAGTSKALFDFLYLKKAGTLAGMKQYLLSGGRINWEAFSQKDKAEFGQLVSDSGSRKMQRVMSVLQKAGVL